MIVRAEDLQPDGLQVDLRLELGTLGYEGDLEIGVTGASLTALLERSREGLTCAGRLLATAYVPCSRCLEPYPLVVDRRFDVSYLPAPHGGRQAQEIQIKRDDLEVSYLNEERALDMADLAAEQIYLELPMKPLCAADCLGLCPGCGANLNRETCRCRQAR